MTNNPSVVDPYVIVKSFGGFTNAVDAIMSIERALWELAIVAPRTAESSSVEIGGQGKRHRSTRLRKIGKADLFRRLHSLPHDQLQIVLSALQMRGKCSEDVQYSQLNLDLGLFQPFLLPRTLLESVRPDHELRFAVMKNVRKTYRCTFSPATAHLFHTLAKSLNNRTYKYQFVEDTDGDSHSWAVLAYSDLVDFLARVLERDSNRRVSDKQVARDLALFIECCRRVGYIGASWKPGHIGLKTDTIDAEFLTSHLFGISTGIPGFDQLFGGGGLILADNIVDSISGQGRAVLIKGSYGTGKTLLALQLAMEVARKGGAAWIVPLEQKVEEYLYMIESMRLLPDDASVEIIHKPSVVALALSEKRENCGIVVILKAFEKAFLDDSLNAFEALAEQLSPYSLRLITVDPINVIERNPKLRSSRNTVRSQILGSAKKINKAGTNVLLVAEEDPDSKDKFRSEHKIADTVIRLRVEKRHDYALRFFEITKSRLQREHRGEHPFSIVPGQGVRIFPSSAAVRARIRSRSALSPSGPTRFGLPSLDRIIGENSLFPGDVIVLQGPGGSFKTPLGLHFLLGADPRTSNPLMAGLKSRSLLVAARDSELTVRRILDQVFIKQHINRIQPPKSNTDQDIKVCALPGGHVTPGFIFQKIGDEILEAQQQGYWIDRIMVDDVSYWELACPPIRDDETFGDTLVEFLRRHRATTLFVCGLPSPHSQSVVQRSIVDGSDCAISFEQFDFRGTNRVVLRVLKTRGMNHRRESFEISFDEDVLKVKPSSSLLRVVHGEAKPVGVRLFLHSETKIQSQYNDSLLASLKAVLSQEIDMAPQDLVYRSSSVSLSSASAIDELQVLQIDEFQVPDFTDPQNRHFNLFKFPIFDWDTTVWGAAPESLVNKDTKQKIKPAFMPWYYKRIRRERKGFFVLPYFANLGLLAYNKNKISPDDVTSWEKLADKAKSWKRDDEIELFFDFPQVTSQNYNCLFFEILLSLGRDKKPTRSGECDLRRWLQQSIAQDAAFIYWRLCHPTCQRDSDRTPLDDCVKVQEPILVEARSCVWRHWYTTLNQMLKSMKTSEHIEVRSLPKGASVAGEWYLGVPSYSAAPDVGLDVIKLLTSRQAELERVRLGVGLPARWDFYSKGQEETGDLQAVTGGSEISPCFSIDVKKLGNLVENALRRSEFGCYSQLSSTLAYYLRQVVMIAPRSDQEVKSQIRHIFRSMDARMAFVRDLPDCSRCRKSERKN